MNIGLRHATGDVIIRVDGHSYISEDFVRQCVTRLESSGAACVGGPITSIADSAMARSISIAMSSAFGVGNALFRYSTRETYVDTLAFGAYRRKVFDEIGNFDEELVRNQDDELNYRLTKAGHQILLSPAIRSFYYNRASLRTLWRQYYQYGFWKVRVIQKHGRPASIRHLVPSAFVGALGLTGILSLIMPAWLWMFGFVLGSYVLASGLASIWVGLRHGLRHVIALPTVYATLHLSYGIGFLFGVWHFNRIKEAART